MWALLVNSILLQQLSLGSSKEGYAGGAPWYAGEDTRIVRRQQDLWWHGNAQAVPDHELLRNETLWEFHNAPYSVHTGVSRMTQTNHWWPGLKEDVLNHARHCDSCQRNKRSPSECSYL